jgi:hypothetical protein
VLFVEEGLAIIEGLNNDAPVGCALAFVSGAAGALLWRRSDNICFALLLGGSAAVEVGEGVECKVKAILQARAGRARCRRPARQLSCLLCQGALPGRHSAGRAHDNQHAQRCACQTESSHVAGRRATAGPARTAHPSGWACLADRPAGARQVVDEQQGPRTRKEYTIARVPVGDGLTGQVVDFLLRPACGSPGAGGSGAGLGAPATAPLLGVAPDMDAREQICEALVTGVKVCGRVSGVLKARATLEQTCRAARCW